jgi:hypothetical protein
VLLLDIPLLQQPLLPLYMFFYIIVCCMDVSLLQQPLLPLNVLFCSSLCFPERVCSTAACAVLRCLPYCSFCCTWTCLYTKARAASVIVCLPKACAAPIRVLSTAPECVFLCKKPMLHLEVCGQQLCVFGLFLVAKD